MNLPENLPIPFTLVQEGYMRQKRELKHTLEICAGTSLILLLWPCLACAKGGTGILIEGLIVVGSIILMMMVAFWLLCLYFSIILFVQAPKERKIPRFLWTLLILAYPFWFFHWCKFKWNEFICVIRQEPLSSTYCLIFIVLCVIFPCFVSNRWKKKWRLILGTVLPFAILFWVCVFFEKSGSLLLLFLTAPVLTMYLLDSIYFSLPSEDDAVEQDELPYSKIKEELPLSKIIWTLLFFCYPLWIFLCLHNYNIWYYLMFSIQQKQMFIIGCIVFFILYPVFQLLISDYWKKRSILVISIIIPFTVIFLICSFFQNLDGLVLLSIITPALAMYLLDRIYLTSLCRDGSVKKSKLPYSEILWNFLFFWYPLWIFLCSYKFGYVYDYLMSFIHQEPILGLHYTLCVVLCVVLQCFAYKRWKRKRWLIIGIVIPSATLFWVCAYFRSIRGLSFLTLAAPAVTLYLFNKIYFIRSDEGARVKEKKSPYAEEGKGRDLIQY